MPTKDPSVNAKGQAAFKKRKYDAGLVQVNLWVHPDQAFALRLQQIQMQRDITLIPILRKPNGRVVKADR